MVNVDYRGTSVAPQEEYVAGISDVAIVGGLWGLTANSYGVTGWALNDLTVAGGGGSGGRLAHVTLGGRDAVISFDFTTAYVHSADDPFATPRSIAFSGGFLLKLATVSIGGVDYFVTSYLTKPGIYLWHDTSGVLHQVSSITDGFNTGYDATGLTTVTVDGTAFILATSEQNDRVDLIQIQPDLSLQKIQSLQPTDGIPINGPSAVETFVIGGETFVALGSAGSGSVTLFKLTTDGLVFLDQVADDNHTRFRSLSDLEIVQTGGETYVIAAGENGFSILLMLPNHRLLHLATVKDDLQNALRGISGIDAAATADGFDLIAAGLADRGVSLFSVETDYNVMTTTAAVTHGTAQDDIIQTTMPTGAEVRAGAGNDIIIDGIGSDHLYGNTGADVFVLTADDATDWIHDFELGVDRIDASGIGRLYDLSSFTVVNSARGLELHYGADVIILPSTINVADLRAADLFDLTHISSSAPFVITPPPPSDPPEWFEEPDPIPDPPKPVREPLPEDPSAPIRGTLIQGTNESEFISDIVPSPTFDATAAVIFRLYQATFDRAPDDSGLAHWVLNLNSGSMSEQEIARAFIQSTEFQITYGDTTDREYVTLLYNNVLDRNPDPSGMVNWTTHLANGMSREGILLGFSNSLEFQNNTAQKAQAYGKHRIEMSWSDDVFRLYQATLGRAPDWNGFHNWMEHLASDKTYLSVVSGFVGSVEFGIVYGDTSTEEFVTLLYNNVLDRTPDASGMLNWVNHLSRGMSRERVVEGFAQSTEFVNKSVSMMEDWMESLSPDDALFGLGGDDILFGGTGRDTFVFNGALTGTQTVTDIERWDTIHLTGSAYKTGQEAIAAMHQDGVNTVLDVGETTIIFSNSRISSFDADMFAFG